MKPILAVALGTTVFGMRADLAEAPDVPHIAEERNRVEQSATAQPTNLAPLGARASATRHKTPWPVLPRLIIDYANRPNGYFTGNLTEKDSFVDSGVEVLNQGEVWSLGLMIHKSMPEDRDCGWIRKQEVQEIKVTKSPGICIGTAKRIVKRSVIGTDYNCPPHVCVDGTYFTRLKPKSRNSIYLNYYRSGKKAYDKIPATKFKDGYHFRYTTPDKKQAVGRAIIERAEDHVKKSEISVWGFTPREHVPGNPRGGTLKK